MKKNHKLIRACAESTGHRPDQRHLFYPQLSHPKHHERKKKRQTKAKLDNHPNAPSLGKGQERVCTPRKSETQHLERNTPRPHQNSSRPSYFLAHFNTRSRTEPHELAECSRTKGVALFVLQQRQGPLNLLCASYEEPGERPG